jgi:hypothetical protein
MRLAAVLLLALASIATAADRAWQSGKWVDSGIARNPFVGDPHNVPGGIGVPPGRGSTPEVGRYVIETADARYTVEDIVPISSPASFDRAVRVGESVTFAVNKSTIYIKGDGTEYRLRLVKKESLSKH